MDPNETLRQIAAAVEAGEIDQTDDLIDALQQWTARGGFPPRTIGPESLGTIWHLAVTKAVSCRFSRSPSVGATCNRR